MSDLLSSKDRTVFEVLSSVDVSTMTAKKSGKTYLSWAHAWAEVCKKFHASYKVREYEGKPYLFDPSTGYMIFTEVSIAGVTHVMWLPVMDGANNAMKHEKYAYQVKEWVNKQWSGKMIDKWVEPATMFDINKAIMRCLVKNLAMFGLGLYIYQGEDLPTVASIDTLDIVGLSALQIFRKYDISIVEASKYLQGASGAPFVEMPNFEKMTDEQKEYMERPDVIQWLANVAGKA